MIQFNIRLIVAVIVGVSASTFFSNQTLNAQGRLSQVRDSVRRHDAPSHGSHDDDDDDNDDDHHSHRPKRKHRGDHHSGGGGVNLFMASRFSDCQPPTVVEHVHVYEQTPVYDQPYTFQESVVYEPVIEPGFNPGFESWFSSWHGRVSASLGANFDDLSQGSLGVLLQNPGSVGIDFSVGTIREAGTTFRDHLWLGDINLVYEAINSDDLRARVGVGINWLGDHRGGEAGANLTFGLDWQITPNWILSGETDLGSLGDSDLFHAQVSLGRQFQRAEWMTGYDHYDVGGVALGGVFTGLRFRF